MTLRISFALTLILAAGGAAPVAAALLGDLQPAPSIEVRSDYVDPEGYLERFLTADQHPDLAEPILLRHARATLRAKTSMAGDFSKEGGTMPILLGPHDAALPLQMWGSHAGGELFIASAAAYFVGSGAVPGEAPVIVSSGGGAAGTSSVIISSASAPPESGQPSVPLPPAVILFGSGLLVLPLVRRCCGLRQNLFP